MAHSALESAWGRSQIANDKNNFFGIAAYDTSPYDSAKKFDDVVKEFLVRPSGFVRTILTVEEIILEIKRQE